MANAVSIPVKLQLEDLRSIISQIQNSLKGVKVDSSAFSKITKELEKASSLLLSVETQTSKAFTSQNQFVRTEKEINSIEEALQRAKLQLKGLKFKDLKLTDDETLPFKEIEKEIDNINKKLKDFSANQVKALEGTSVENIFKKNKGRGLENEQFSTVFKEIQKEVEITQRDLNTAQENYNKFLKQTQSVSNTESVIKQAGKGKGVKEIFGENVFKQFFTSTGKAYKLHAKEEFIKYLQDSFVLDDATIDELRKKSAAKVVEILQGAKTVPPRNLNANLVKARSELANKTNANTEAQNAYQQVSAAQRNIGAESDAAKISIDYLNQEMREQQQLLLANRRSAIDSSSAYSILSSQLNQMRDTLDSCNTEFIKQQRVMNTFNSIKTTITNFMGFTQVLNLAKRAIDEAANHIKTLDKVMTEIAVVTDFSQSDLWGQIDTYSSMAQQYGVAIKGVYEVSALYYQMGLDTNEVMARNVETLKMAKIASLDYATAADYMTVAMNGFKMEAEEASRVTDVYSAVAAATASDTKELATAMSKTAASLESVGVSFEGGTAMIATMVESTRESSTNIGSALKSIASRYGELTKNPASLIDSEGEAMSFNKVDEALQSVGISMKTTEGQFRSMEDVILELSSRWSDLSSVQQRYYTQGILIY